MWLVTHRDLTGQRETVCWALLLAVAVVVCSAACAHGAAARHLTLPPLTRRLSGWFGCGETRHVTQTPAVHLRTERRIPHLVERPSSATSGTDTSSDSLGDSDCTSCAWTSAPAWAPGLHTTETHNNKRSYSSAEWQPNFIHKNFVNKVIELEEQCENFCSLCIISESIYNV